MVATAADSLADAVGRGQNAAMRTPCIAAATAVAALSFLTAQAEEPAPATIVGRATLERAHAPDAAVRAFAIPLHVRDDGRVVPVSKPAIFRAAASGEGVDVHEGRFELQVAPGPHAVFAFVDLDGDRRWNPATPEAIGWYAAAPGGCFDAFDPARDGEATIVMRAPTPFPAEAQHGEHGSLRRVHGVPVLHLRGDAHQRGFAHGNLLAPQIVDFFRFYVLEDKQRSTTAYSDGFGPFLESHFAWPAAFRAECEAVVEGMRASGADLAIPELGRDFSLTDLFAINSYIETRAMRASCTQFAAWGGRTEGTDVAGGMITGRNMDGECDLRKVTVSHFVVFAVAPSEPDRHRYVSMMWPGFVGTISGINEHGFYTMENAGTTGPGPVVGGLVPISWTMREALARLDGNATKEQVARLCDEFANSAGGSCGPGCIMLFATPFEGQQHPAFVFEGDRFGDAIRTAGEVLPHDPQVLVCSNHFHRYGRDDDAPGTAFGRRPSFSSQWRYEAGANRLDAWQRVDRRIGTAEMQELLQTVAHGTTEYAIVTRPNLREFDVALASLACEPWDAPYRAWVRFAFDDVFPTANGAPRER